MVSSATTTSQQRPGSGAGDQQQRTSSRFSNDWASYMHLQNQLETAEPDPTVIVVKKSPAASRRPEPEVFEFLGTPAAALESRLKDAGSGDRRSAVTATSNLTDDMSEYGEDEVVLSAATRVGLKRTPSAGAAIVFNRAGAGAASNTGSPSTGDIRERNSSSKQPLSPRSPHDSTISAGGIDPSTLVHAGVMDSGTPSRTSIGEDSVSRHRNSNPSRYSNGTGGWQTPSETQSQQSPRSSRSVRPLTLPPAEPLPPLPSPTSHTPHLPSENGQQNSPESNPQGLRHSASTGRLPSQITGTGLGSPPATATGVGSSRSSKALGIEIRPPVQSGGTSPGTVSRVRATLEAAAANGSVPAPLRSPVQSVISKGTVTAREREFMDRVERQARSNSSSTSASSNSVPLHKPVTLATGRLNGESTSTVTSPVTPTAATMSTSTSSGSTLARTAEPKTSERQPPSASAKAQAIFNATNGASSSSSRNPLAGARGAASEQVHGNRPPSSATGSEGRTLTRRASSVNLQSRRTEMEEDKVIVKAAPQQRAVILKKAETRFAGAFTEVAQAFKQLQAEKLTLENIIRATTPLDGLGDQGQLSDYLKSMTAKVASNEEEIRKLLELLDQQRAVMDYMLETHEREADAHFDQIDELQVQLDIITEEAENHRANCVQLTADLDRAHNEAVAARADVLKLRAALQQESTKCEQAMTLLRAVQHQMKDRDQANKLVREELESLRARHDDRQDARGRDENMTVNLSAQHAEEMSAMSEELRRDLSSKHEADLLARSEQIRAELAAKHADELELLARQLRQELAAQHRSEIKNLQAKLDSSVTLAKAQAAQRMDQTTSAHEAELKTLHSRLGKLEREGDSKAALEAELRDLRTQHVAMVNQLAERTNAMNEMEDKSRGLEKEVGILRAATAAVPPPVPGKEEDRSVAALQMRLQAAEARAAAAEKEKEEMQAKIASLEEGGTKSELASLRAQLVDQRAREVQIRNAYKNVQYELRKAQQSFKADDRKRSFLTGIGPISSTGSGSVSGHGGPQSPLDGPPGLQRSPSNSSQTNRQLKRLSLPLVSKGERTLPSNWMEIYQREGAGGGGGGGSRPTSASSTNFSHMGAINAPPSSFRQPLTSRNSYSTPSPPDRRRSSATDGAGDDDGRSASSTGTAGYGGPSGGSGGVLGYGGSSTSVPFGSAGHGGNNAHNGLNAMGMSGMSTSVSSSSSSSSATANAGVHQHGQQYGRPMSEASAYSINEEDEEVMESDGTSGQRTHN